MSDISVRDGADGRLPDLTSIPTEDLRRELADAIGVTARTLQRLAAIWHELESRGEDLSALRGGLFAYLPAIADGRLDPAVVVRCAGQAMLIKALMALPVERQRDLLESGVPMITIDDGGSLREERRPLERIGVHDIRRVFVGDAIRPPVEQAKLLAPKSERRGGATQRHVIVKVRLSPDDYDRVRSAAAKAGKHSPTFVRDILLEALG